MIIKIETDGDTLITMYCHKCRKLTYVKMYVFTEGPLAQKRYLCDDCIIEIRDVFEDR